MPSPWYSPPDSPNRIGVPLPPLLQAEFLERLSRFSARVLLEGRERVVCVRNSSRLRELLRPGAVVWLREAPGPNRKTRHDLVLAGEEGSLVSVDAHLPNRLAERWLAAASPYAFHHGSTGLLREVGYADSRLDFRLSSDRGPLWVEVKSVSLVRDGAAYFPDAPTTRGARHLRHLSDLVRSGSRAAVLFIIQRPDAAALRPNTETDPLFASALAEAARAGVEMHALTCGVTLQEVYILGPVPVQLV